MATVHLNRKVPKRILYGHPWIYKTEIERISGEFEPGDIVSVVDNNDHFIGKGYINLKSMICVRLLTHDDIEIDKNFFIDRIQNAWDYRKAVLSDTASCRVVYGEGDYIPALIVDKYGDYLVCQFLSLGIDKRKEMLVDILKEVLNPRGIYERDDVHVRELEGLEQKKGFLYGKFDTTQIFYENGIKFYVDMENGQKTGYFLDQKENRRILKNYVKNADVLDMFCHTGSFAVHAASYGAKHVTAVDISKDALKTAERNAALNKLNIDFVCDNVFDCLHRYNDENKKYDVVILDPPAFTKSKDTVIKASKGYKEINLRALKLIKSGGFLMTASCSQHISAEMFKNIILDASLDAGRSIRLVEERTQSKDHPILPGVPETQYLKFMIYNVI